MPSPTTSVEHCMCGCGPFSYIRPSGHCPFTPISCHALSLYLVEGFE